MDRSTVKLTPWEIRILRLRANETPIREIARSYRTTEQTIKNKLGLVFAKLGLKFSSSQSRAERLETIKKIVKNWDNESNGTKGPVK